MQQIRSILLALLIQAQRIVDHIYRQLLGLPQLKRSQITHELFLGGQYGIRAASTMQRLGITGIVNMRMRSMSNPTFAQQFSILNLPTPDFHAPSIEDLHTGITFISNQIEHNGKVYVHCRLGEGRGPTMVIAYLMSIGMAFDDAQAQVKKVRPFVNLSKVQVKTLQEFESQQRL